MKFTRLFAFLLPVFLVSVLLSACGPSRGPFREYYVSTSGDDATGTGSEARPWRTIQYALDHVVYDGELPPRINLARGIYREDLRITRSIVIRGVGVADVLATAADPDMPTENVSAIWRSLDVDAGGGHTVTGDISVEFEDLVFYYGRVEIDGASAIFHRVEFQDVQQRHGLRIVNSPLTQVLDSWIFTPTHVYADLGIDIENSIVLIENTELGHYFDHVIDIGSNNVVSIENSTIWGSNIYYADGIRLHSINEVNIINNRIIRDHPDAEAADAGPVHSPPYAGIQISGWTTGRSALVTIRGNEIRGFDVGIGINSEGNRVLIQGNDIQGLTYPISSFHYGYSSVSLPVVDLGGGALGSTGGNIIAASGDYGFFHQGPWDAMACFNNWSVPPLQIPERIFDQVDDPDLGLITFDCSEAIVIAPTEELAQIYTPTPTQDQGQPTVTDDSLCWTGPGSPYDVVSSVAAGTQVEIVGRGEIAGWFIITNPRFIDVSCWIPEDHLQVDPGLDLVGLRIFAVPPLPTPTPPLGCLYQGPNDQQAVCYPIDQCPVKFEDSQGACTP